MVVETLLYSIFSVLTFPLIVHDQSLEYKGQALHILLTLTDISYPLSHDFHVVTT